MHTKSHTWGYNLFKLICINISRRPFLVSWLYTIQNIFSGFKSRVWIEFIECNRYAAERPPFMQRTFVD